MMLVTHGASGRLFKKTKAKSHSANLNDQFESNVLILFIEYLQTLSFCCEKDNDHDHPLFRYTGLSAVHKYRLVIFSQSIVCWNSKAQRSIHICKYLHKYVSCVYSCDFTVAWQAGNYMQLHNVRVNKCNCATNVTPSYVLLSTVAYSTNIQMAIHYTAALSWNFL